MSGDSRLDFASFYAAELARVVAQVYALTGDLGESEEAAQEAFLRAWSRWQRLSQYDDPRAWVQTVAHRLAISRWRRSQVARAFLSHRRPREVVDAPGPQSVALVRALRQLPPNQQRVLVLHHMADRSVAEIAAIEGEAEGTVKARLSRGRAALAVLLADDETRAANPPGNQPVPSLKQPESQNAVPPSEGGRAHE
ncbi:MAG: SigE family RNA polymerase sigma factor [Acidothermaceae bacterium]